MHRPRRWLAWLLALGLALYGLAPVTAARAAGPRKPGVCEAAAVHSCACHPKPATAASCCCSKKGAAPDCAMGHRPCAPETPAAAPLWSLAHPLPMPEAAVLPAPWPAGPSGLSGFDLTPCARAASPLTPPPRS